jgi:hypothetical protein
MSRMGDHILALQELPEYQLGYNSWGQMNPHRPGTLEHQAFALGQQHWWDMNQSRNEPNE